MGDLANVIPSHPNFISLHRELDILLLKEHESRLLNARIKYNQARDLPSPLLTSILKKAHTQNVIRNVTIAGKTFSDQQTIMNTFSDYFAALYDFKPSVEKQKLPVSSRLPDKCFDVLNNPPPYLRLKQSFVPLNLNQHLDWIVCRINCTPFQDLPSFSVVCLTLYGTDYLLLHHGSKQSSDRY